MPNVAVYYHDPVEVEPRTSWTGLCPPLLNAHYKDIKRTSNPQVLALFDYARPDAVITVNDRPIVSIEQTAMNPSGHNIPQRFSFQVRAAELGVPSILYYPEYSRRTFSDPNVRYLNVRVPLAQLRLSEIYRIPAVSIFWPTDPNTKLPTTDQKEHREIANFVKIIFENHEDPSEHLNHNETIRAIFDRMRNVASSHSGEYDQNPSLRRFMRNGLPSARVTSGTSIDPPNKSNLQRTDLFLKTFRNFSRSREWSTVEQYLLKREFTFVFTGTANHARNDSEHPWPGYLSLIDILYARSNAGQTTQDRDYNLVYSLYIPSSIALPRINNSHIPTATYIVDTFSDLLVYSDAVVPGRPIRGSARAFPVLSL